MATLNAQSLLGDTVIDVQSQSLQAFDHDLCITTVENSRQQGRSFCQRRNHESPVGQAFGTGGSNGPNDGMENRLDFANFSHCGLLLEK